MPPKPILPLEKIDLTRAVVDEAVLREQVPQRDDMAMLDRIVYYDEEEGICAGVKSVREDEFWTTGHFPGRPILPGVLMLEAAGQLSTYHYVQVQGNNGILGFGSADGLKFRGMVQPPADLLIIGRMEYCKQRSARFHAQGFVGDSMVFEGNIVGIVL